MFKPSIVKIKQENKLKMAHFVVYGSELHSTKYHWKYHMNFLGWQQETVGAQVYYNSLLKWIDLLYAHMGI